MGGRRRARPGAGAGGVGMGWFTRAIRPPDDIVPNPNDPVSVPPSTVGPDQLVTPGGPHGVTVAGADTFGGPPPSIIPSAWSGWPADWWPPLWNGSQLQALSDTAWMCLDLNSAALASMPPYLVDAAPTLSADWLTNPEPDVYTCWDEFARTMFWDYQALGEAFLMVTARYATGWPARFYVVPPWTINVELENGVRRYEIGRVDVTADILHIRYQSSADRAHGTGPLEAGGARLTAAKVLTTYATTVASTTPPSILKTETQLGEAGALKAKAQWVAARQSAIGEPAVLDGGMEWQPAQISPREMALLELSGFNESRIANLLRVPPVLVGLPSGGDS